MGGGSKFFPFRVDTLLEGVSMAGNQHEVSKAVSLYMMAEKHDGAPVRLNARITHGIVFQYIVNP